jgi:hypothetical protein
MSDGEHDFADFTLRMEPHCESKCHQPRKEHEDEFPPDPPGPLLQRIH